ncbi:MAG: TRAP transporter substrate-binding protein DctP [Proteobacteria bacterium]|nr:TRAP transporter substrate-binding protein DctP [Pseudomonadota bacterium]
MRHVLSGALALAVGLVASGASAEVNLVYNNSFNRTDTQTGVVADEWIARIEKATEGRVKIRHVFGGALLKAEGTLDGVRKGVADAGAVSVVYHIGELPISASLAGSFDVEYGNKLDLLGISAVTMKLLEEFPEFQGEYAKFGVKGLLWIPAGQYSIIGTAKIATVDDFKNKKIRAFGASLPLFIESLGGVPMQVAFGELYTSLQTGVIDGLITNPTAMVPAGFHEVSKHAVTTGPALGTSMAGATVSYVVNLNSWNKIPKQDQDIVLKVSKEMTKVAAEIMTKGTAQTYVDLQAKGVQVHHMSKEEVAKMAKMTPDFFAREAKRLNERGLPGDRIFARYKEIADDYASGKWKPW